MAHDDSRRRRERPRRSTGGSEAYLPPRREFTRRDGLNYNEGEVFTRWESNDEAEPATRPFVIRRRGDARRRSFRRESTGVELAPEAAVITESPTAVRYVASSDGEDHERFDRPIREYEDPYERRPPPVATRDEVIIERQDGRSRRFESDVNPPPRYVDAEGDGYRVRRPVSPIIEDIDAFDDFHFVLPAEDLSKDAELSDLETPTTESESTPKIERPLSPTLAAPGIYSSSYFGTAELGAQHDVNLTVLHDPRGQKQPLFRWLHVRQEIMNFDAFWVQVSRHIRFRDAERKAVVNLKAEVKRQCVKTRYNPQGAKAFISHFHAFWPQKLEFWRKDRLITAENWGKILELAEGLRGDVRLRLKIADAPDMVRTFLKPDAVANKASEKRPEQSAATPEYLHVFTLLSKNAESSGDSILQDLREQLSAAEKFLTEKTSYTAQRGYKRCELMTKDGAQEQLEKLAVRVEEKKSDTIRRSYDERLDVFNMADTLFQLFFPLTFHGPTTGKYWGALSKLMHIPELDEDDTARPLFSPISEMRSTLWQLTQDIQSFQNIMSFAGKEDRAAMALPHELVTAWLHIVFGLIYGTYALDWYTHMTKAKSLLREGMQKMIEGISAQNLLDKAVMQPTEIMSLIALNLLQDDVGKYDDICDTYSLYLNSLDTDITTKPSNRMYQHRIDLVKQEMTAIRRNLVRQRNIIAMLRNKMSITDGNFMVRYGEEMPTRMKAEYGLKAEYTGLKRSVPAHRYYEAADEKTIGHGAYDQGRFGVQFLTDLETASKLSSTDAEGFRSLFLTDCANLVEQREYEFKRDTEYAEELERDIRYKMEWTKDKQENAIYAFTLVTIIFLPLSAISSIFGMNTNDIRNMDFDQWLYWVVALPVTVIIIIAGLWWMDELSNATDWLIGRRKRSSEYEGSVSYKSTSSKPTQSVMDYDSIGRSSEDIPGVYRRTRYLRPIRNYTGNVEAPLGTMPRRRRTSFYKY
ncbi:hypothetical protein TrVGV298_007210 [Trichoderma virens]|nr:hypothetical protein TrVGV298_007210 [Trichoderma virens]